MNHEKIEPLNKLLATCASTGAKQPAVPDSRTFARILLSEAQNLLDAGFALAALLEAAVAYEHTLRKFARVHNIHESGRVSVLELLTRCETIFPAAIVRELHKLRQIRNRVSHMREAEYVALTEVHGVLQSYIWVVAELEQAMREKATHGPSSVVGAKLH